MKDMSETSYVLGIKICKERYECILGLFEEIDIQYIF